ncbi:tRNA synthetases class II core domain (F)-domain-containing protein [Gymnopilus junonius]|uniref:phenylalanine--tRNA ligase n=1 Tax=Gymnopilus junonius TaxID=109634 RepID=A0A9P5NYW3_GYMJU|nr:tRNA synthetases class II core domain (F)-domain-containing protein [Gymnopilus junonius]
MAPLQLKKAVGDETAKIGQGRAFKNRWIAKDGDGLVKATDAIQDQTKEDLQEIASTGTLKAGEKILADLRKRKLVAQKKGQWFTVYKGSQFSTSTAKPETDLTADMLVSALHPLLKSCTDIWINQDSAEMPTSSFVESGSQHPARDLQDTFYLSPFHLTQNIINASQQPTNMEGYGSAGYRAPWSREESSKLLLRTPHHSIKLREGDSKEFTHGAASTTETGQPSVDDGFRPAKLFSIDRVVVADRNLTLADLIGFMRVFFSKMGIEKVRFKPAYNPYTEPSLEIFAFHPLLDRWVEVGNSGMFRPEMLEPMGFPKDVRVHGWGLSLERPTMIRYGINNIRTLVGHKVSIEGIETSPAVMF